MGRSIFCAVLLWAVASQAETEPRAEFTAAVGMRFKGSRDAPSKRKLYVGREAMRLDYHDASGFLLKQRSTGRVTRVDTKNSTRWDVSRHDWTWPSEVAPGESPCGKAPACVKLKTEVRNGRRVEKWRETRPRCRDCETTFIWVDRTLGFEVRREVVGRWVQELTQIQRGAPPAELLVIPAGVRDPSKPDAAEAAACKQQGGTYMKGGQMGWWLCNRPMKDGGKPCSSGKECESGFCVAPKQAETDTRTPGACQATSLFPGCLTKVEGGIVQPTICH